jgi:hypothetical protein
LTKEGQGVLLATRLPSPGDGGLLDAGTATVVADVPPLTV